jgi:tRNA(Ile)-lysidine synthase
MTATGARSPAGDRPPEALVARFREELDRLCAFWPDRGKMGLAVSGGPDSLAMMLLAQAAIPHQFEVATVDHGLRPESPDECAAVAVICEARSIPCAILKVEVEPGNVQANAREARYRALGQWAEERGLSAIATAHHADDQAETLLMRLNRGSGLGLAGIGERDWLLGMRTPIVRPLLGTRRDELGGVVSAAGLEAASDPSNADERFDRVRVRRFLAESDWLDPLALARSAQLLGDLRRDIHHIALEEWESRVTEDDTGFRYVPRCGARSVEIEIVAAIVERMSGKVPRSEVARLIDRIKAGESGNLAGVLATIEGHAWVFRPEPPRRTG